MKHLVKLNGNTLTKFILRSSFSLSINLSICTFKILKGAFTIYFNLSYTHV